MSDVVIIVWDSKGRYFQNWIASYNKGAGIEHGKAIAKMLEGTYLIVEKPDDNREE